MKFSPQIHLFSCFALLAQLGAPALVRADPPNRNVCARINTPKAKLDKTERSKNRQNLFSSWNSTLIKDLSRQHRSLKYISKTQVARNAQQGFLKTLTDNISEICEMQLAAEQGVTEFTAQLNKGSGKEMCGRFEEIEGIYAKANNELTTIKKKTDARLNRIRADYLDKASQNLSNLDAIEGAGERQPLVTFPHSTSDSIDTRAVPHTAATKHLSLREEVGIIWGSNMSQKNLRAQNFSPDPNAFFGGILRRLEAEVKQLDFVNDQLATQRTKMETTKNDCAAAGFTFDKATTASEESDISNVKKTTELPPQEDSGLDQDDTKKTDEATQQPVVDPSETPGSLVETPKSLTGEKEKVDPYQKIGDEDINAAAQPPLDPPPKVKEEGWVSRNKGLLLTVGGGAAAVGGILWYKNNQDKKAEQDASVLEMEAHAIASSQSGSSSSDPGSSSGSTNTDPGSSSGSTNTDSTLGGTPANVATPQGSNLLLSGAPSSAAVNTPLSEITVTILNPEGILTQDSHTEITVSCAEPANCSLTGTLTVNTNAGKAKFNDLRFNNADQNVKLMFSAPGYEPISAGTFSVTGGESTRE